MNHNIIGKNMYNTIINSYIRTPSPSKIKGTIVEAEGDRVKLDIGGDKILDLTLEKPLDAEVGESVAIDRRDILESKLMKAEEAPLEGTGLVEGAIGAASNKYDYILKSLNLPIKEESIEAVRVLDSYGVDVTRENILSFMAAKEQLSALAEKLDYDKVIKLRDKDIDFEKESLQKVLQELEGVKDNKRPFSILRFLGLKKDMTTEEAERIAYNLYGSKMGKDVTDIIKALDKAGVEITKDNIEHVNRIFHKLHNIKDIEDTTIIDSVKNKIEVSIDNLYKLKNAITKGAIKVEEKMSQLVSKAYGAYNAGASPVTEKDLMQIEGDIKARIEDMGLKVTEGLVKVAKDVIARGLDLTRENLERIVAIRGSIEGLNMNLDYEKTAVLMASNVDVEKVDVVQLMDMVNTMDQAPAEAIGPGLDRLALLELMDNLDIRTLAFHMKLDLPMTLEGLNLSQGLVDGQIHIEEWMDQLANLEGFSHVVATINIEDLTQLLTNLTTENRDLELEALGAAYLSGNKEKLGPIVEESYGREIARALLQNELPLNTGNIQDLYRVKKNLERLEDGLTATLVQRAAEEGLVIQRLPLDRLVSMATLAEGAQEKGISTPEENMTQGGNTIEHIHHEQAESGPRSGESLSNMGDMEATENIGKMETMVAEKSMEDISNKTREIIDNRQLVDNLKNVVDTIKQISPERRNTIISLLMKNSMPLTLKEVQKLSFFLNNEKQIGHELDEILNLVSRNENPEVIGIAKNLKESLEKINSHMKAGLPVGERPYEDFAKMLRDLESKASFLSKEERISLQKSGERLLDSLELQLRLNREDTLLQLPLMMGENLKNLQIYVMRDKKGSKKIDPKNMSVLLNFDTNNMGNLNIYVAVNYKNIVMKMGLGSREDQHLVEHYRRELEAYLEDLGYSLKELSFRIEEEQHILSLAEETEGRHRTLKRLLDVRI